MAESRETIQALNAWLDHPRGAPPVDAATDFAVLCRSANQRLQRCKRYLDKQLVGEAIADAESPPDLLEMVGMLSVPRREEWDSACSESGLDVAQPLLTDIAVELNSAYSSLEPIKALLRQQRKLVLQAGATAKQRLAVMRDLARQSRSTVWDPLVAEYQRLTANDWVRRAEAASRNDDLESLEECAVQLGQLDDATIRRRSLAQLVPWRSRLLERALVMAHAHADVGQGLQMRARLKELERPASATSDSDVAQAQEWLAGIDRQDQERRVADQLVFEQEAEFQKRCRDLETALDDDEPIDHLERLAGRLDELGRAPPDELAARFRDVVGGHHAELGRRRLRRVALAVGGVAVAAALGTFLFISSQRSNAIAQWSLTIKQALDVGDLERAVQHRGDLEREAPAVLSDERLRPLIQRLRDAEAAESTRSKAFVAMCGEVETQLSEGRVDSAHASLARAVRLATRKLEPEAARVAALRKAVDIARVRQRQEIDATCAKLEARVAATIREVGHPLEQRIVELEGIQRDLDALKSDPRVEVVDSAKLDPIVAKLDEARTALEKDRLAEEMFTRIGRAAADPARLEAELRQFSQRLPGHRHEADLRAALADVPAWKAVAAWSRVATRITRDDPASTTAEIAPFLQANPNAPNADALSAYAKWCASAEFTRRRLLANKESGLGAILEQWYVKELKYVEDTQGAFYHVRMSSQVAKVGTGANAKVVITYQDSRSDPNRTEQTKPRPIGDFKSLEPLPTAGLRFREIATAYAAAIGEDEWELAYWDLANHVIAAKDMHSVLQVILLRAVCRLGEEHAHGMHAEFARAAKPLSDAVTDVNWVQPSSPRDQLRHVVNGLDLGLSTDPQTLKARREQRLTAVLGARVARFDAVKCAYRQVGILIAESDGRFLSIPPQAEGTTLEALMRVDGTPRILPLGRSGPDGEITLEPAAASMLSGQRATGLGLFVRASEAGR